MNKIYKVIWSKVRNCYVVVSEMAKRNGKCSSSLNKKIIASFLAAGLVAALPMEVEAAAFHDGNGVAVGVYDNAWGSDTTAGANDVYDISWYKATGWAKPRDVVSWKQVYQGGEIRYEMVLKHRDTGELLTLTKSRSDLDAYANFITTDNNTAFGQGTYALGLRATAFGERTYAGGPIYLRGGDSANSDKRGYIDYNYNDNGVKKIAFIYLDGTPPDIINNGVATTIKRERLASPAVKNATAFGERAVAIGDNSTAFGFKTKATATNATAFGHETQATDKRATAFGISTVASGRNSTAFGYQTTASGVNATSFGSGTTASGIQSTAFGYRTKAIADNATSFGHDTSATANRATAFGISTVASGRNSTAFGYLTTSSGENATAWGSGTQAVGGGATAWGTNAEARAEASTAWGNGSVVHGGHMVGSAEAGGTVRREYFDVEVLIDNNTNTRYIEGTYYVKDAADQYILDSNGNKVTAKEIIKSGFTDDPTDGSVEDPKTGRQKADQWIRNYGRLAGYNSTAFGKDSVVYAENALAALGGTVGQNDKNEGLNSAAIGVGAIVTASDAYAMGNGATIGTGSAGSVALGGQDSDGKRTTIGEGATNSFAAIGGMVGNDATNAIAIGGAVSDYATSAVAIGNGANASHANSVALGSGSETALAVGTTSATVGRITFGDFAGTSPSSVVSIGTSSSPRQLINVAAGRVSSTSTDAINGSQLYAAYDQLQWQIGTGADGGTNKGGALAQSTVGKPFAVYSKNNVQFIAGVGIDISSADIENGYGIKISRIDDGYLKFDANVGGRKTNQFGSTISVVGEGTKPISEYSGKNVKTDIVQDADGNSTITVKIDENPSFTSVTTGDTKIDTNGLTISNGGPFGNVTITKTNIDMGGNQIHNVAPGTSDKDAVNMSQLNDLIGGGSGKYGLRVGDTTGTTIGQSLNNNVFSVKGGEGTEVPATPSGYSARNITTRLVPDGSGNNSIYIQMSEAPEFKGSTGKSVKISGSEGSVTASNGAQTSMITPEGLTISGAQPIVIQQGNVDVGGNQIHNVARGTAGTDGVNVSQLNDVKWNIGTGAVNGGTNKHGGPLDLSPVGKQDGIDRSNIRFNAGAGVDISYSTILTGTSKDDKEIGYNIDISAKFQDATISFDDSGHYIQAITYEGKKYLLAGGGSGTAAPTDVISDNRAVTAELLEHYNEDIKGYEYAIEVESPFMNLNGLKDEKGKPAEIHTDDFAYAKGENAIAIGRQAEAEADNSLAVGHNADAKAENATAIGMNSHAHAENSVSIGVAASSSGNRAIVIGTTASYDSSREDPANATLPHQGSRASGQGSVVLGDHARAQSEIYTLEIAKNLDLIGTPDHLTNDAIAIGTKAEVRATNAIALGGSMSYTDENGVTKYGETNGRYVGAIVGGSAKSGIAIGGAYGEQGENGEIKQEISAAATYGLRGIAIGTGATVANKDDFTALENVLSNPEYQKAKGDFQKARAEYLDKLSTYDAIKDVPLNDPTVPSGMQITQEDKDRAKYQMNQAKAALEKATQTYSLELKKSIRLQEKDAIEESDAIAIGTKAVAQVKESIALGSNSVTTAKDRAGSRTGLSGYDPLQQDSDNDYFRGDEKYKEDDPVWRSTAGSLSVGGGTTTVKDVYGNEKEVTVTRRISNVAAGIEDSDAVNVAQLKRATSLKTDSRNTSIGLDKDGNMVVNSPYLNIQGVKTSSDYTTIINRFGTPEEYIQSLEGQKTEINSRIDSINVSREMIKDSLQKLGEDYKAQKITEAAYLAQKADYEEQWDATGRRLDDLAASLKEKDTEIANAPTHYQEAKEYYDSQANASGTDSIAVGNKSVAGGKESVSIGANNTIGTPGELNAKPDAELEKEGQKSIAIGSGNTVMGKKSMAIGTDNTVTGDRSGAIGDPNVIDASDSYSVGNDNKIAAGQNNVFALGNQVTTTTSNSVFLGSNSAYVADGKTTAGMSEYSSATINGRTYNYAGGKPAGVVSVGDEGKERRIQNVAAGKVSADSTDAINGSQLYSALDNVNNSFTNLGDQISNVDNRTRKGIAGAAALAALHPMEFDPDDKLTFAAGMGHYRGETAAALGLFYRADEKVMFSLGGTVGNGENMVNAGVSFSLDRTPRVTGSRTAMAKEIVQLREQVAQLTALVNQIAANQGMTMPVAPTIFPDTPENHYAYVCIDQLQKQGYITGYAGRALTRQQIAAALDMAMAGGAKLDERIVKEFEPELSHVRVAHVEGKGNEEGEWYERPRASHDKYEDKHKIEKKPFRVEEKKVTSKS